MKTLNSTTKKRERYIATGSSLDYAYDEAGAKYAFTFEIYGAPEQVPMLRHQYDKVLL